MRDERRPGLDGPGRMVKSREFGPQNYVSYENLGFRKSCLIASSSLLGIITAEPREDGFFLGLLCFLLLFVIWRNMRVRVLVLVVGFRFADAGDLRARKLLYSSHLGRS